MPDPIIDQVVDFYSALFGQIFSESFQQRITDRLKQKAVLRQVEEAADAASQSLIRFYLNERLSEQQVANLLAGFAELSNLLKLNDITNPNIAPETIVDTLLGHLPCPESVQQADQAAIYRVSLHSIVQVLMLVGPVMAEWQKLNFSSTFELPRRVVNRLNQISEQLGALGRAGQTAADEAYELSYRDYLLQRFHRIEAGTVRMTTNLDVDLRELFVMPQLLVQSSTDERNGNEAAEVAALMNLAAARKLFGSFHEQSLVPEEKRDKPKGISAFQQVKDFPRNVIVGVPGSGKSTFLEWLQLQLAAVEEELVMSGKQAIPLLLRVRQLDPRNLPRGAALIEKATASKDRAALMPLGWINRQMEAGCVILMIDGLDETEPELRDRYVLPWLHDLCREYPHCRYLISSRPVGYPPGALKTLGFAECNVQDFDDTEIGEYCRHWCTAVRLARNEPEEEARREGAVDGARIVQGFGDHPYIRNLAHNPLMLSAICLVNYFEGGELPKDRAVLYRLCVEGLLHHWDQRRGIHSEFTLEEKLRACREVALAMQADDRAEYEADKVQQVFANVLHDPERAKLLLEHIRYRTGLLLERRPGVFAFAHLTFQEYLAARSIYEGNRIDFDANRLAQEHHDGRWKEVIVLYCGLASTAFARDMIEKLITQPDSLELASILTEAYLSAGPELLQDTAFRRTVLERVALAPGPDIGSHSTLGRFLPQEVAPIANQFVGKGEYELDLSVAYGWLFSHSTQIDEYLLSEWLKDWRRLSSMQTCELVHLLHAHGSDATLQQIVSDADIYTAPGPQFPRISYSSQAQIAWLGLAKRASDPLKKSRNWLTSPGVDAAFLQILRTLAAEENTSNSHSVRGANFLEERSKRRLPQNKTTWSEFASLSRKLAERLREASQNDPDWEKQQRDPNELDWQEREGDRAMHALTSWADSLERAIAVHRGKQVATKAPIKRRTKKVQDGGNRV